MRAVARDAAVYRKNDRIPSWLRAAQSSGYKTGTHANSYGVLRFADAECLRERRLRPLSSPAAFAHGNFIGARGVSGTAVTAGC